MQALLYKFMLYVVLAIGLYICLDGLGLEPWVPAVKEAFRAVLTFGRK